MLYIYNSLTRQKEKFIPNTTNEVNLYVCGMTVYDYCHIGHARSLVAFDMINRYLRYKGFKVTFVRNITDIDDKIIDRANERNITINELTDEFITAMDEDCAALNIMKPDHEPRATQHIEGMLVMIKGLMDKGFAYQADNGDIYYRVRKFPDYGKLSNQNIDELRAGERVEVDDYKEDPLDFVLWKHAKDNEPFWESPFGNGRPGWHIECSVMSESMLGVPFDIHGGGMDLKFPHHECEIAQSEGYHDKTMANYWLHNGFINVDDEKMSKSLGNFFTIREILAIFPAEVLRFFILTSQYRTHINYSAETIGQAQNGLKRLYTALSQTKDTILNEGEVNVLFQQAKADKNSFIQRFEEAMDDDFNTPQAISVLYEIATELNTTKDPLLFALLKKLGNVLGLLEANAIQFLQGETDEDLAREVNQLIEERNQARLAKNWALSDEIRNKLSAKGIILEDKDGKTTWRKK